MKVCFASNHTTVGSGAGRIEVQITSIHETGQSTQEDIFFTVPADFHVHNDCVATCLLTLCGRKYATVEFNFPISRWCAEKATRRCALESVGPVDSGLEARQPGSKLGLNFSGGFDSLAAQQILPGAKRISTDFGGACQRETDFFTKLEPDVVCSTDFRQKGFAAADWTFMGAASVLYADYLDLAYVAFGTVLEATPWNLRFSPAQGRYAPAGIYAAASLEEVPVVRGLTEFGTTMIVMDSCSSLIPESLASLASASSEKLFRKKLILKHLHELSGRTVPDYLTEIPLPRQRIAWGQSFAIDFLSLYFIKHFGVDFVRQFAPGVEQLDLTPLSKLSLEFYRKWNPNFVTNTPQSYRAEILRGLSAHQIFPYDENDWFEVDQVRRFLAAAKPAYWS